MESILKGQAAKLTWYIYKGPSKEPEDFDRMSELVIMLIHHNGTEKIPMLYEINADYSLSLDIPSTLGKGIWGIKTFWEKNNRRLVMSEKEVLLSVVEEKYNATMPNAEVLNFRLETTVASYGYDGLSAYEIALLNGKTSMTEEDWLNSIEYPAEEIEKIVGDLRTLTTTDTSNLVNALNEVKADGLAAIATANSASATASNALSVANSALNKASSTESDCATALEKIQAVADEASESAAAAANSAAASANSSLLSSVKAAESASSAEKSADYAEVAEKSVLSAQQSASVCLAYETSVKSTLEDIKAASGDIDEEIAAKIADNAGDIASLNTIVGSENKFVSMSLAVGEAYSKIALPQSVEAGMVITSIGSYTGNIQLCADTDFSTYETIYPSDIPYTIKNDAAYARCTKVGTIDLTLKAPSSGIYKEVYDTQVGTSKLADKSVTYSKLASDLAVLVYPGNMIDTTDADFAASRYLNTADGHLAETENENYNTTGFMIVDAGSYYITNKNQTNDKTRSICFYDSDKEYLGSDYTLSDWKGKFLAPAKAAYMRVTYYTGYTDYQVTQGAEEKKYSEYSAPEEKLRMELMNPDTSDYLLKSRTSTEKITKSWTAVGYTNLDVYCDYLTKGSIIESLSGISELLVCTEDEFKADQNYFFRLHPSDCPYTLNKTYRSLRSGESEEACNIELVISVFPTDNLGDYIGEGAIDGSKIADTSIEKEKLSEEVQSALNASGAIVKSGGMYVKGDLNSSSPMSLERNSVQSDKALNFTATIGSFTDLTLAHGDSGAGSSYITIDSTYVYMSYSGTKFAHGMTFANNIQVSITKSFDQACNTELATLTIASNGVKKSFYNSTGYLFYWAGNNGKITASTTGSTLTDCTLSWSCSKLNNKTWLFGDSYFNLSSKNRWLYYLGQAGYGDQLFNAYSGETSDIALQDLQNLMKIGTPKRIVWCLGMNDIDDETAANETWKSCFETVQSLCKSNNIELIAATIPTAVGGGAIQGASAKFHINKFKNAIVRASGCRYIDFDKAVGANETTGYWYDGMLNVGTTESPDGVHPTETGAITLFMQAIADCPELVTL